MIQKCVFVAITMSIGMLLGSGMSEAQFVNGAREPEKLPYFVKYAMFFSAYERVYRSQLIHDLSSRDDAILSELVSQDQLWEQLEGDRFSMSYANVCSNRGSKNAVALARETSKIANQSNGRRASRYRATIESLSNSGQDTLKSFVDSVVTPTLSTVLPDEIGLAEASPDEFMTWFDNECYVKMTGESPPEVEEYLQNREQDLARKAQEVLEREGAINRNESNEENLQ